ncbi:MAG: hypothetical protein AUH42_04495 [Gemmatimonadetes bacterium 13_1_40CM_70_11]|nr:MAG: hypothetical protein AUH42_04495 [Gemmatimonadetes bacterium 13_1_40CM_70_11]
MTRSYIGACALLAGCVGRPAPLVPVPLDPADRGAAAAWAGATAPAHQAAIRFRWKYRDDRRSWAGRATARVAPPDSMRFDYAGPLGLGAGAAVVVGDSQIWADPAENFRSLVPAIRMLWAALGVVRPPADTAQVSALHAPPVTIWRFVEGADTLDYRATDGAPRLLEAEWRRAGKVVARSRAELDDHARPHAARIDFPEAPARFELTVSLVDTEAIIAPALWRSRR